MKSNESKRALAVDDWTSGKLTIVKLAAKYKVSPATITNWARKAGLPHRRRGRWCHAAPPNKHRAILELRLKHGVVETAQMFGISKQRVSQIAKRWKEWDGSHAKSPVVRAREGRALQKREIRHHVVSLRLTRSELEALTRRWPRFSTAPSRAARGLVLRALAEPASPLSFLPMGMGEAKAAIGSV